MAEETDKNFKGRTKKEVILWRIYLLIGFVASVVIASMGYIFYVGNHMTVVHTPLTCAAMEIRVEVTTAHLWCEEIINGDRDESIDAVWVHLDEADWYTQAMLVGGENPHWKYYPVDDARIRRDVKIIQAKLAEFRAITEERFAKLEDSQTGSEIDRRYDAVFAELMNVAEQVETEIKQMISRDLRNFHIVQTILIFICVALTVLVGIVIGRFIRRQIRDELKLQAANKQLDASNQQLRANEQQLVSEVAERKSAEERIHEQREFLRNTIESLGHPFYVIDANDNTVKMANVAAWQGELPEKITCYMLFHKQNKPCDGADHPCPLEDVKKTKQPVMVEHIHYDKDGNPRNVEVHCYPIFDNEQNVTQMIEYCLDITERKRAEQLLRKERDKAQKYLDVAGVMLVAIDVEGRVGLINKKGCEILGYEEEEIIGKKWFDNFLPERVRKEVKAVFKKLGAGGIEPVEYFENPILTKDGDERLIAWHNTILRTEQGDIIGTLSSGEDITERKRAEEALQAANQQLIASEQQLRASNQQLMASEQQLKAANQQLIASQEEIQSLANFPSENSNPVLRVAKDGIVLYSNEAGTPLLTAWDTQMGRRLPDKWCEFAADVFGSGSNKETECEYGDCALSLTFTPVVDLGYVNVYGLDITERKRAEQQLKISLEEKEVLLREIHHRVKNNLQVIVSLLSLQSEYVQDKQAVGLFRESQFRVKSMALLHERLYETEDLTHINFSDYIRDLTNELLCSYGPDARNIKLKINVKDVFPSVDVAVPCALIINELVTNCLKHAFPKGRAGEIRIEFDLDKQDSYTLLISDNGVGFAKDVDFPNGRTLGLQLVSTLAEQLQASVVLDKSAGTSFKISFSKPK